MLEIGGAQTAVYVVAAQAAHELGCQVQLFQRAVRAGQTAERGSAVVCLDMLNTVGNVFKRSRPIDCDPLTVLLQHRLGQTLIAVQGFVTEAVAVGDPAFVDVFVLQRHHAHDAVVFDLHNQIGTGGIVRADRLAAAHFPGTRLVTEWLAGQSTDRANVNHVAGEFRVDGVTDKSFDFRMLAALRHTQLHAAGNLLAKSHATSAMYAAAHFFHADQRADILVEHHAFFFFVTRGAGAVTDCQILQLAFAALIANRAIQWMVDQQKFHHRLLRFDGAFRFGAHHHALRHRRGAGRHRLGCFFDIHQTHAAIGGDAEFAVVAKMRNKSTGLLGRLNHHAAFSHLHGLAVDL